MLHRTRWASACGVLDVVAAPRAVVPCFMPSIVDGTNQTCRVLGMSALNVWSGPHHRSPWMSISESRYVFRCALGRDVLDLGGRVRSFCQ